DRGALVQHVKKHGVSIARSDSTGSPSIRKQTDAGGKLFSTCSEHVLIMLAFYHDLMELAEESKQVEKEKQTGSKQVPAAKGSCSERVPTESETSSEDENDDEREDDAITSQTSSKQVRKVIMLYFKGINAGQVC